MTESHDALCLVFSDLNKQGPAVLGSINEDGSKDKYIEELTRDLPGFLLSSRAKGTCTKYTAAFQKWAAFAREHKMDVWPTRPGDFCLYILHLVRQSGSLSAVDAVFYGTKWLHECANLVSPTEATSVKNALEAAKRALSKKREPMEPVEPEALCKLCAEFLQSNDLTQVRCVVMSVLAFSGFLRANELRNLQLGDFLFHDGFMTVVIRQAKTDQFRQGNHVDIAKTDTVACPVMWVEKYFKLALLDPQDPASSKMFVFRQISSSKYAGKKLVAPNKPLSYTAVKEAIVPAIRKFSKVGVKLGTHSFRAGGASAAAKAGVSDRLFQRHGRWKTESAKNMYVKESLENRLKVSASLGI